MPAYNTTALLEEVERCPFDDNARLELADYYCLLKNPRGELIKEQCSPEPDVELVARLLNEHGRTWAAQDLGIQADQIPQGATFEFHKGFAWWPVHAQYICLQDAIDAGGYDHVNNDTTSTNFSLAHEPVVINAKLVLYAPHQSRTSPSVIYEMRRRFGLHLDVDQIWELLSLGAAYPDLQCRFPIIGVGSSWVDSDGHRSVPCLDDWDAGRDLHLYWFEREWYRHCRFAAVRQQFLNPGTLSP